MGRLVVRSCALLTALTASSVLTLAGAPASAGAVTPESDRFTRVQDARGDQVTTGSVPRAARASADVHRLVVRRDARQLHLTLTVADVRSFTGLTQTFAVELRHPRLSTQRFTTTGGEVTKTLAGENARTCGSATRAPKRDVMTMRLPFRCLRSVPGALLDLRTEFVVGGPAGSTVDRTRTVKADVR